MSVAYRGLSKNIEMSSVFRFRFALSFTGNHKRLFGVRGAMINPSDVVYIKVNTLSIITIHCHKSGYYSESRQT